MEGKEEPFILSMVHEEEYGLSNPSRATRRYSRIAILRWIAVVRTVLLEFCFEFFQDYERFVSDDSSCPVFDAQGYFEAYGVPPGSLLVRITEGQCFKALVLVSGGCGRER